MDQPKFVPFIVETGGRVNRAGLQILNLLSTVQGAAEETPVQADGRLGAEALAHGRKRATLRSVLRELTKQQGFMLAQIVVEIPARDRAA